MNFKDIELKKTNICALESLEIGLTSKCNFTCKYCCVYKKNDDSILQAKEAISIIKSAPDIKRVKLSGGEVLLAFKECVDIIDYCSSHNIMTQINTNGSILNKEKIKTLEKVGLSCLHFSLNNTNSREFKEDYKISEEIYERIINNIKFSLWRKSLETVVETIISRSSIDNMLGIHNFVNELGVREHEIQLGIPVCQSGWDNIVSPTKLEEMIKTVLANKETNCNIVFSCVKNILPSNFIEKIEESAKAKKIYFPSCIEGRRQLHVHSNGDILICELGYPVVIGNVFNGDKLDKMLKNRPTQLSDFINNHPCKKRYHARISQGKRE